MKYTKRILMFALCALLFAFAIMLCTSCEKSDDGPYTASFYADGKLVSEVEFNKGDETIALLPAVPKKSGYVGAWKSFKLGNKDIKIEAVYAKSFTVKIVADDPYAVTFEGETEQVITPSNPKMKVVTANANDGYAIDYYVIDGVKYDKRNINWTNVNADTTIVVYTKSLLNDLPVVRIDTDGESIKSKETYTKMVFDISNTNSNLNDIPGGIRLRGNSTMAFAKKAYRIKFDTKQSLFGLKKAKSWVLLAEYLDPSNLHNHAALTIGQSMPGLSFTPTPFKVNLYVNGEYRGLYTLCEQVEEEKGRMDIEMDAITTSMKKFSDYNWFVSLDYSARRDASLIENETLITIEGHGNEHFDTMYFELKYPEKSDFPNDAQFNWFISELRAKLEELLDAFDDMDAKKIKSMTNVASLIDYVIIDEIMGQEDHDEWHKSFNIYYTRTSENKEENGKINFGPIWDYDWSLHTPWTGTPNEHYETTDKIDYFGPFFNVVHEIDEFYKVLKERYNKYAKPALKAYIDSYDDLVNSMEKSIEKNADLWYGKFDDDMTENNIAYLKEFLICRYNLFNKEWAVK